MRVLQAPLSLSSLLLYLHLILPIQPFYIFITGVGRLMRKQSAPSGPLHGTDTHLTTQTKKNLKHKNHFALVTTCGSAAAAAASRILIERIIFSPPINSPITRLIPIRHQSSSQTRMHACKHTHAMHPFFNTTFSLFTQLKNSACTVRNIHLFLSPLTFLERVQQE